METVLTQNTSSISSDIQPWERLLLNITYNIDGPQDDLPSNLNSRQSPPLHRSMSHSPAQISSLQGDTRQSRNLHSAAESQCSVCAEDRRLDEYPTELVTSACMHSMSDVCKQCMRTYIASSLSSRGTTAICCPVCREMMSYFDVWRNAAPEDFNRYDERMALESLQNEPGFRWCPYQGCPGGQIQVYGDAEPKVTCNHCRQPYCFIHRIRWHGGLTCSQYDDMTELERQIREAEEAAEREVGHGTASASLEELKVRQGDAIDRERREAEERQGEAYVRNISKRCPGCTSPTEKNGGCKHMTCTFREVGL